jgi:TDG/mug DNA glycosylase family protein
LDADELRRGGRSLERKVLRFQSRAVAVLGAGAYRAAFGRPRATVGPQPEGIGSAELWVLPNPSGRTAAYQLPQLVEAFSELRAATG